MGCGDEWSEALLAGSGPCLRSTTSIKTLSFSCPMQTHLFPPPFSSPAQDTSPSAQVSPGIQDRVFWFKTQVPGESAMYGSVVCRCRTDSDLPRGADQRGFVAVSRVPVGVLGQLVCAHASGEVLDSWLGQCGEDGDEAGDMESGEREGGASVESPRDASPGVLRSVGALLGFGPAGTAAGGSSGRRSSPSPDLSRKSPDSRSRNVMNALWQECEGLRASWGQSALLSLLGSPPVSLHFPDAALLPSRHLGPSTPPLPAPDSGAALARAWSQPLGLPRCVLPAHAGAAAMTSPWLPEAGVDASLCLLHSRHLWSLWEAMVLGERVLVLAPDPTRASAAVAGLLDLLCPLPYASDYRPFLTVQDPVFEALVREERARAEDRKGGRRSGEAGEERSEREKGCEDADAATDQARAISAPSLPHQSHEQPFSLRTEQEASSNSTSSSSSTPAPPLLSSAPPPLQPRSSSALPPRCLPRVVGASNPLIVRALSAWPNCVAVGFPPAPAARWRDRARAALLQQVRGRLGRGRVPPGPVENGVWLAFRARTRPDAALLASLARVESSAKAGGGRGRGSALVGKAAQSLVRRHFQILGQALLQPLLPYCRGVEPPPQPLRREKSAGVGDGGAGQAALDALPRVAKPPDLPLLEADAVLQSVRALGSESPLVRAFASRQALLDFYARFLDSENCRAWLAAQRGRAREWQAQTWAAAGG